LAAVLTSLERDGGWKTARIRPPSSSSAHLTESRPGFVSCADDGRWRWSGSTSIGAAACATLPEILRINAWLIPDRNGTRDYLDVVALADRLGEHAAHRHDPAWRWPVAGWRRQR
jgi:hypothetical protein